MDSTFLEKYGIMQWDEYMMLNKERLSVNKKIIDEVITKRELLLHFKVELSLLKLCKKKIKELGNTQEVVNTQILVSLCDNVFIIFQYMHVLFSIEEELLTLFINVCEYIVKCLNARHLDILLAVIMHKNNQNIWIQLIKLHLNLQRLDIDKLLYAFSKGVCALNDSLPLWKILIRHLQYKHPERIETLLKAATKGSNKFYNERLSLEIRPRYLEWCRKLKGIDAARDLFNELKELKPACRKLYLVMIAIEREIPNYELDTVRKLYEEVTKLCGRDNIGVWIDYMRFEQEYNNKGLITQICCSATLKLQRKLISTFVDEKRSLDRELWTNLSKEVMVVDE